MGLMETLQYLVELCISIQNSLDAMTQYFKDATVLHRSLIDLSAIDVAALEKNVALLASYREDIDYIIESLERLSGNIHLLFWLLIVICVLIIAVCLYVIVKIVLEHKNVIIDWLKEKLKK